MAEEGLLTTAERRMMLEEIGRVALAIGREKQAGAPEPLEVESGTASGALCGRERLVLLEAHWPTLERAILRILDAPHVKLHTQVVESPPERARHPIPNAVLRAIQRGNVRPFTASSHPPSLPFLAERMNGRLPRTLPEQVRVATSDTPENRYVAGTLARWRRDLRAIAMLAGWETDHVTAERAAALEGRMRRLAEAFAPVAEPGAPAAPTGTLLRDPRYRVVHDLDRRCRRLLRWAWDAPSLTLPPREEWQLYEMWCFFRAAAALQALGLRAVGGDSVRIIKGHLTVSLAKGQASWLRFEPEDGWRTAETRRRKGKNGDSGRSAQTHASHLPSPAFAVSLYYNRVFPSAATGSGEAASRTHAMIPDLCLERDSRFLLLDAKFRTYALPADRTGHHNAPALYEDIDKMHAYRDAILRNSAPVVEQAWCLHPGAGREEPRVIAYPPATPEHPFGTAGVGALRLRPGEDDDRLARLLAEWLSAPPLAVRAKVR